MPEIKCPKCGTVFSIDEKEYDSIVKTIRDNEFEKSLKERLDFEQQKNAQNIELMKQKEKNDALLREKKYEEEIASLKNQLNIKDAESKLSLQKAVSDKEKEIDRLNNQLLVQKNEQVERLKEKDAQIEFYKDLKTRMSTKLVGETLEQHCLSEFNKIRMGAFPNAYFEKDNDARSGSKGDFIFRETTEEGAELISIMFEMKNENDETATKHKNEDFFKELDKDRREKGCEYAVLVSMLEPESDFYNAGIVDVSYRYPKMYVVRPQCFISIITLLRNASLNAAQYKNELMIVREQNLDIAHFEDDLEDFKARFDRNVKLADDKFTNAIDEIDKTITHLTKVKESLLGVENNLRIANNKAQDLTIKSLTRKNPTMREKFESLKQIEKKED